MKKIEYKKPLIEIVIIESNGSVAGVTRSSGPTAPIQPGTGLPDPGGPRSRSRSTIFDEEM